MNKLNSTLAISALASAFLLASACAGNRNEDAWGTYSETKSYNQGKAMTRAEKRAHQEYVLARVVLVRMDEKGTLELDGDIVSAEQFSTRIRSVGESAPGKPVLFYYDSSYTRANTKTIGFVVRECREAGLGKIYRDIPEKL